MFSGKREEIMASKRRHKNKLELTPDEMESKRHGDEVESLLQNAGAKRMEYSGSIFILPTQLMPQFRKGDVVQVRVEDGSWRTDLRALSDVEKADGQLVVWVCWEDEWQSALKEGREPEGTPWPYEQVEFWDRDATDKDAFREQGSEHETISWKALAYQPEAWDALVKRFDEVVFYVSYTLLDNREIAEDNTLDTFLRAYSYFFGYPDRVDKVADSIGAYLCQIAKTEAINKMEKMGRGEVSFDQASEESYLQLYHDEPGFEQIEIAEDLAQLLAHVVDELNENAKKSLELWLKGWSAEEIVSLLKMKEKAVTTNVKLRKARNSETHGRIGDRYFH